MFEFLMIKNNFDDCKLNLKFLTFESMKKICLSSQKSS